MKVCFSFLLLLAMLTTVAQSSLRLPIIGSTVIKKGIKYKSQSGKHYLLLKNDGNLVVMTVANKKVWGLNEVFNNVNRVSTLHLQEDGNLVAKNSKNGFLWSALSENPKSNSQLIINGDGVLQLVAPGSNIVWASDGKLSGNAFIIDYGWKSYRLLDDPKIVIMGSRAVTPAAMNAVTSIYKKITDNFTAKYPKNRFDGYIIYVTNGEPWAELKRLRPIGQMWPDQTGTMSGDYLRGGTAFTYLWIDEQMICKKGVRTRNEAFATGKLKEGDHTFRSFDQVVHEFGHAIDFRFNLGDKVKEFYKGGWDPVEQFPWNIQNYFGTPGGKLNQKEEAFMKDIFKEQLSFSCNLYNK